jgi:hypothetical protein
MVADPEGHRYGPVSRPLLQEQTSASCNTPSCTTVRSAARRRPDRPTAVAAGEATDSERQQLLLETAFLAGEVPAVWCRQQMAAIAAGTAQHHPSL